MAQRRLAHSLSKNLSGGQQSYGRRDKLCTIYRANSMSSPAHLLSLQLAGWHSDCKGQRNEKRKGKRTKWTGLRSPRRAQLMFLRDRSVTSHEMRILSPLLLLLSVFPFLSSCMCARYMRARVHTGWCLGTTGIALKDTMYCVTGKEGAHTVESTVGDRSCRPGNGL